MKTLQSGRALAAISVASFHLSIGMGLDRNGGNAVFQKYTQHGNLGVDFFFVLSGFIILFAHVGDIGKPAMWREYLNKRFSRLFPIYWLYTTVFVLLVSFGVGKYAVLPSGMSAWLASITLIRFSSDPIPLLVAWTLFHELAFYLTFSLLILNKRVGIAFFLLSALLAIALFNYPGVDDRTALNVYTSAYGLTFMCGMGAYWLYKREGSGVLEFIAGIAILVAALLTMPLPDQLSKLVFALGFGFVLAGITKLEVHGYIKTPALLKFIGDASYTIYLTHEAFEGLLLKVAMKAQLSQRFGAETTYFFVLVGTIALGGVAYALIERPLLLKLRKRSIARVYAVDA